MNKCQITYIFIFLIYTLLFLQGCTETHRDKFFNFIKEIYPKTSQCEKNNKKVLIINNISLEEIKALTDKLYKNNFGQWYKLDSSAGFIIGVDGETIFKGTSKKAIIYSKSKIKYGKYVPVILFDINEKSLYCVLSTDLGG